MRPGREIDTRIAREVFGNEVWASNKMIHERAGDFRACGAALGESAPLAICEAALRLLEKRRAESSHPAGGELSLQ